MPKYKIEYNGKVIEMDWDGVKPPTKTNVDEYLAKQADPHAGEGMLEKSWRVLNTPAAEYTPQMKTAMEDFEKHNPRVGKVANFAANMVPAGTSPLSVLLEAATGGASIGAGAFARGGTAQVASRFPRLNAASRGVLKASGAAQAAHGAYKLGEGIYNKDYPSAAMGAVEGGFGVLGYRTANKLAKGPTRTVDGDVLDGQTSPLGETVNGEIIRPELTTSGGLKIEQNGFRMPQNGPPNLNVHNPYGMPEAPQKLALPPASPRVSSPRSNIRLGPTPPVAPAQGSVLPPNRQLPISSEVTPPAENLPARMEYIRRNRQKIEQEQLGNIQNPTQAIASEPLPVVAEPVKPQSLWSKLWNDERGSFQWTRNPKPKVTPVDATAEATSRGATNDTAKPKTNRYRAIPDASTPKDAMLQWGRGTNAAKLHGTNASNRFADLQDPSLIDKFEAGDRSGRLKDVAEYFEEARKEMEEIGILQPGQSIKNYLRHEFEQNEDQVSSAFNKYRNTNPSFAKERRFPSYVVAERAGLTRKYKTIPEIVKAYETKINKATRDKELYDWLVKTDQLEHTKSPKAAEPTFSGPNAEANREAFRQQMKDGEAKVKQYATRPGDWRFKGKNAAELAKYRDNFLGQDTSIAKPVADVVSMTKNISLAGGAPGTKYNMHGLNTARRDAKNVGYVRAIKEFVTDPTGKKARQVFIDHADILPELVENGYTYHPVEDMGDNINIFSKHNNPVSNAASEVLRWGQETFERPLFERALPALKLKRTVEAFNKLSQSMPREQALKEAAKIGNTFYGGVEKTLRNKTNNDLMRIGFLAPDWLESSVRLAINDWKGAAKTVAGKGNAVDKIHAKSLARGAAMAGGTAAAGKMLKDSFGNKEIPDTIEGRSSDALTIPIGTSGKKQRRLVTVGTSDDSFRVPLETIIKGLQRDPAGFVELMVTNKASMPAKALKNFLYQQDDFGNPISGKTKYGQDISMGKALLNNADVITKPVQPQLIQFLTRRLKEGDKLTLADLEQAAMAFLEGPVKYSNPPKIDSEPQRPRLPSLNR